MSKRKKNRSNGIPQQKRNTGNVGYVLATDFNDLCCTEYTSLDQCPEIITGCRAIAQLVASMTIYLMSNTKDGDVRIKNELSRKIDINPMDNMTRYAWMEAIVMNLLLYGKGNSIVLPHTYGGILRNLEPISASRVSFLFTNYSKYKIVIDGREKDPSDLIHITLNPDKTYLYWGRGLNVSLRDLAKNLKQSRETENAFMSSKWKPSIIVKVDAMIDEFSTPEGRQKILDAYVKSAEAGEPWLIPGEQFQVEQVRPLSLADLAIADTAEMDKRLVAAILGVPPFVLGVGEYNQKQWNNFIQTVIGPMCLRIAQELTKKLIISENWYLRFNTRSLMDWDVTSISQVFGVLYDRGIVTGNEVRSLLGYDPMEGLNELHVLENYLPIDRLGDQKKLNEGSQEE